MCWHLTNLDALARPAVGVLDALILEKAEIK